MPYQIRLPRRVEKELGKLPLLHQGQVLAAIRALAEAPRPSGCVKLIGRPGWRIRVGDYQVIYDIEDAVRIVTIVHVGHRGAVYR